MKFLDPIYGTNIDAKLFVAKLYTFHQHKFTPDQMDEKLLLAEQTIKKQIEERMEMFMDTKRGNHVLI